MLAGGFTCPGCTNSRKDTGSPGTYPSPETVIWHGLFVHGLPVMLSLGSTRSTLVLPATTKYEHDPVHQRCLAEADLHQAGRSLGSAAFHPAALPYSLILGITSAPA